LLLGIIERVDRRLEHVSRIRVVDDKCGKVFNEYEGKGYLFLLISKHRILPEATHIYAWRRQPKQKFYYHEPGVK
jgi:hypothetical protein